MRETFRGCQQTPGARADAYRRETLRLSQLSENFFEKRQPKLPHQDALAPRPRRRGTPQGRGKEKPTVRGVRQEVLKEKGPADSRDDPHRGETVRVQRLPLEVLQERHPQRSHEDAHGGTTLHVPRMRADLSVAQSVEAARGETTSKHVKIKRNPQKLFFSNTFHQTIQTILKYKHKKTQTTLLKNPETHENYNNLLCF